MELHLSTQAELHLRSYQPVDRYSLEMQMLHELVREPTLRYHLQIPPRLTEQLEAAAERKPESKLKPK